MIAVFGHHQFSKQLKSTTISLSENNSTACQSSFYYENKKLALTTPITKDRSKAIFRLNNIKYCVGVGLALKEVIESHSFDYQSHENELLHGLYIITTQGYSWSHSNKEEDDILRKGFNTLYSGAKVQVQFEGESLKFICKMGEFTLNVPKQVTDKYTLCFCAYLHEKEDEVSIQ